MEWNSMENFVSFVTWSRIWVININNSVWTCNPANINLNILMSGESKSKSSIYSVSFVWTLICCLNIQYESETASLLQNMYCVEIGRINDWKLRLKRKTKKCLLPAALLDWAPSKRLSHLPLKPQWNPRSRSIWWKLIMVKMDKNLKSFFWMVMMNTCVLWCITYITCYCRFEAKRPPARKVSLTIWKAFCCSCPAHKFYNSKEVDSGYIGKGIRCFPTKR